MAEPLYTVGSLRMDNTVVSTNKSLSYSQDNKVAVATDQGIVIVYLNRLDQFIGRGSLFGETEILPTPDRTNTYDVGVTHSQLEASLGLNSEEFMRLVLDKTLTPKTDCSMTSYKLYKQVAWSPRHVSTYQSCMLATLTRDHRLCLWSPKKKVLGCHHSMIARMSDMLHDHEKSHDYPMANEMSEDTQNGDLMKFKHRTYSLAAVCMSWSGMVYSDTVDTDDCSYSYLLAVAMKSGHVVIWKVPDVSDFSSELCSTTVATSVYTHTLNPLTIQWCLLTEKCSIILTGHSNGLINAFPVFTTETGISVGPTVKVWSEQDHIAVVHLTWDRKTRLLIANKGVYLIKMNMNVIGGEVKVLSLDHHLSGAGSLGFTEQIAKFEDIRIQLGIAPDKEVKTYTELECTSIISPDGDTDQSCTASSSGGILGNKSIIGSISSVGSEGNVSSDYLALNDNRTINITGLCDMSSDVEEKFSVNRIESKEDVTTEESEKNTDESDRPLSCELCDAVFTRKEELVKHTHKPHRCLICKNKIQDFSAMDFHLKSAHGIMDPWRIKLRRKPGKVHQVQAFDKSYFKCPECAQKVLASHIKHHVIQIHGLEVYVEFLQAGKIPSVTQKSLGKTEDPHPKKRKKLTSTKSAVNHTQTSVNHSQTSVNHKQRSDVTPTKTDAESKLMTLASDISPINHSVQSNTAEDNHVQTLEMNCSKANGDIFNNSFIQTPTKQTNCPGWVSCNNTEHTDNSTNEHLHTGKSCYHCNECNYCCRSPKELGIHRSTHKKKKAKINTPHRSKSDSSLHSKGQTKLFNMLLSEQKGKNIVKQSWDISRTMTVKLDRGDLVKWWKSKEDKSSYDESDTNVDVEIVVDATADTTFDETVDAVVEKTTDAVASHMFEVVVDKVVSIVVDNLPKDRFVFNQRRGFVEKTSEGEKELLRYVNERRYDSLGSRGFKKVTYMYPSACENKQINNDTTLSKSDTKMVSKNNVNPGKAKMHSPEAERRNLLNYRFKRPPVQGYTQHVAKPNDTNEFTENKTITDQSSPMSNQQMAVSQTVEVEEKIRNKDEMILF